MELYEKLVMQTQQNFQQYQSMYAAGMTPVQLSEQPAKPYQEQLAELADQFRQADYVIIGGASGLSAAGGGDFYYKDTPSFYQHFGKFEKQYGIKNAFAGMQYPYKTREAFWGYLATFLDTTQHAAIRQSYQDLAAMLKDKDYYIVTTNQDTQFIKAFDENKVAEIQGDHRFFQCSQACTDDLWDAVKPVEAMVKAMGSQTEIPTELIPRCPHCGAEAFPWVRGYGNFLEGTRYHQEYAKISQALQDHQQQRILFLELGVGRMTPMFIQEPFWNLTLNLPKSHYVSINRDYAFLPTQIETRGLAIKDDIAKVLTDLRQQLREKA